MMEWQGIESAPKDGSRVLVFDGSQVELVEFYHGDWQGPDYWVDPETLTHWMPLPSPPK